MTNCDPNIKYQSSSNYKVYNTHREIIKNFNNKKLHKFLFVSKVILIVLTILWFIFFIVMFSINKSESKHKDSEKYKKAEKILILVNNVFFYVIIVFVFILYIIILYITGPSWSHIFRIPEFTRKNKKNNNGQIQINENYVNIPEEQLSFTLSLNWWMIFYLLIVTMIVTYAKIKHDPTLIYNLF